jgi:16S rRNA (guanine527-N7)-methyltransferase
MNEILHRLEEKTPDLLKGITDNFDFEKLNLFLQFLRDKNEIGGFFSKGDLKNVLDRHLLESLIHVHKICNKHFVSRETNIADVGTGPGLPGYLFFCRKETPKVTLIDSQKRKLKHLEEFCRSNHFTQNPNFLFDRAEDVKSKFDFVVMRSAIPYPWSIELVSQLVKFGGYFIPFLGKPIEASEREKIYFEKFGFSLEEEEAFPDLEFLGYRHVKYLKKTSITKHSPREWSQIQKEIRRENGQGSISK